MTSWFYNSEETKTNKDNDYGTFSIKTPKPPSKPIKKIELKVPLNVFNVPCKENNKEID